MDSIVMGDDFFWKRSANWRRIGTFVRGIDQGNV
jgi:hypothetical protein